MIIHLLYMYCTCSLMFLNYFSINIIFQKEPYKQATHLAQNEDPWNRLNSKCTLSSSRREVFHFDPQAPKDSLDFILKSEYDHHDEFLRAKNETLYQPESKGSEHG